MEEPPQPSLDSKPEAKRIGRGRQSSEYAKVMRDMLKRERERKLKEQLERASKPKPPKIQRVKPQHIVKYSPPMKEPNDAFDEEIFNLKAKIHELEELPDTEAEVEEIEYRIVDMQNKMHEWIIERETCMQTKGASINMPLGTFKSTDIRNFVQNDLSCHLKNLEYEMKKRFYKKVLESEIVAGGGRSKIKDPDELTTREKKNQKWINDIIKSVPTCKHCKKGTLKFDYKTAVHICIMCGVVQDKVQHFDQNNVSFIDKDQYNKVTLPYDPLSHFKEFLSRLQAMERTQIPPAVIDAVKKRCKMNHIDYENDPSSLTYIRCRTYLQLEGFANRFENICSIIFQITGHRFVQFTEEQVANLTSMFIDVTRSYKKFKGDRTNLLSYSYQVHKYCQLLGIDEALPFLPLFKDVANLSKADEIWKKICADLGYAYIESV